MYEMSSAAPQVKLNSWFFILFRLIIIFHMNAKLPPRPLSENYFSRTSGIIISNIHLNNGSCMSICELADTELNRTKKHSKHPLYKKCGCCFFFLAEKCVIDTQTNLFYLHFNLNIPFILKSPCLFIDSCFQLR